MHCVIGAQARFVRNNGQPASNVKNYERLWRRYLAVFDHVTVVGRVFEEEDPCAKPVRGPDVSVIELPGFRGPLALLANYRQINRGIERAFSPDSAYILRLPSLVSDLLWRRLRKTGHPYGVEVAGDPYNTYAPEGNKHPFQPLLRWHFTRQVRLQCAGACAVAYCSQAQRLRYPPAGDAFVTYYSQLVLSDDDLLAQPRQFDSPSRLSLVSVGTLRRLYKGPDVLVDAVAQCVERGLDVSMTWLGDGPHRAEMQQRAQQRGVGDRVHFIGQVPAGKAVMEHLDAADLFAFPSRAEGLPKALVEAMARGLPCIGSTVGGIPELLHEEDLVPAGDARALADKICEVTRDPERMTRMSQRNLEKAREYRDERMDVRRNEMYQHVRERTQQWLSDRR
ncbi:MAG: glycosyltransferase [Armatimonadota bacterium]